MRNSQVRVIGSSTVKSKLLRRYLSGWSSAFVGDLIGSLVFGSGLIRKAGIRCWHMDGRGFAAGSGGSWVTPASSVARMFIVGVVYLGRRRGFADVSRLFLTGLVPLSLSLWYCWVTDRFFIVRFRKGFVSFRSLQLLVGYGRQTQSLGREDQ